MRWLARAAWERRRFGAGAMVATLTVGAVASAQGAAPAVDLRWTAPPSCPSRAAVLGEAERILEGGAATAHRVDARATVTRAGERWHVELAIQSDQGSGERSLEAGSCAELASAVALIVAVAVDPTRRFAVIATGPPSREGIEVGPCLGVDLSRVSGTGFGGEKTLSGAGSWLALEGGLLGTWALASLVALRVGVDLQVPTSRPAFVVLAPDGTTAASLHRPASVGGRFDLGAEIRFR